MPTGLGEFNPTDSHYTARETHRVLDFITGINVAASVIDGGLDVARRQSGLSSAELTHSFVISPAQSP
jgi:hypothetical protein